MNIQLIWKSFTDKLRATRPFLRTKIGSRLALLGIADFIILFFAPLIHGFVGAALFGCVASVYLVLMWRRFDKENAVIPAALLSIPMVLDMLIYGIAYSADSSKVTAVISALLIAIAVMFIAAKSKLLGFIDTMSDMLYVYLAAGAVCVAAVVAAWVLNLIVMLSWWILCIIAFVIVAGIFGGVVYSTAAYTASDGRRQARKNREREEQQRRYEEYRPRKRDNKVYNVDEADDKTDDKDDQDFFIDID